MVVEELAAQLHIELAVELGNALLDMLRLNLEIFLVVESYFHNLCICFPLLSRRGLGVV
jgi:hypothetical protein